MKFSKTTCFALGASICMSPLVMADDDEDDAVPFDEARLFFELNDTDGDLGIHGKIDGDEWKKLEIEDPHAFFVHSTWFDRDVLEPGVLDPARFEALAALVGRLCATYEIDSAALRFA